MPKNGYAFFVLFNDSERRQRLVLSSAWKTGTHLRKALQNKDEQNMRMVLEFTAHTSDRLLSC
jgi:hypothetical protein